MNGRHPTRLTGGVVAVKGAGDFDAPRRIGGALHVVAPPAAALRIAVVDDFTALRNELIACLQGPGRQVTGAGSGRELDALVQQQPVDIALLDLNLPGEDGLQIAHRLRARWPTMGLVLISAMSPLQQRLGVAGSRRADAHAVLDAQMTKPVDLPALEALILRLQRRQAARCQA